MRKIPQRQPEVPPESSTEERRQAALLHLPALPEGLSWGEAMPVPPLAGELFGVAPSQSNTAEQPHPSAARSGQVGNAA